MASPPCPRPCPWCRPRFTLPEALLDALLDELGPEDCVPFAGDVDVGACVVGVTSVGVGAGLVTCVPCSAEPEDPDDPDDPEETEDPEPTLDAPDEVAEAGDEDDDGGGVGSLHGCDEALVRPARLVLAVVCVLVPVEVPGDVGVAEPVGVAVCVGVMVTGGVVGGVLGVVGVDVTAAPLDWFGAGLTLVSGRLGDEQEGVGVTLAVPLPPLAPEPPWPTGCPLPLVPPEPPEPLPDVDPLFEDEPMLVIACRKPGTAMAVPVNRSTAASAMAGLSHTVFSRSRTVCAPVLLAATARRVAVEVPAAAVAARAAALAPHR